MILSQALNAQVVKNPNRAAFHYCGKDISFTELRTRISRLSYLYQKEITVKNARVGFLASNCPAYATTFFALSNCRIPILPLDPAWSDEELEAAIKLGQVTHLAITQGYAQRVKEFQERCRMHLPVWDVEKKQGGEFDTAFTPPPEKTPIPNDVILLLRTRGLSQKPKLVAFNHTQLLYASTCLRSRYHLTSADRILTTLSWATPFAFIHGLLFPLLSGATSVIDLGAQDADFLKFFTQAKPTRIVDEPQNLERVLNYYASTDSKIPPIQSLVVSSGKLSPDRMKALKNTSIKISTTYGQTENGWSISMSDPWGEKPLPGSEDFESPLPGMKYRVIDENGDTIEGSQERIGQLAISGAGIMAGYSDPDKETRETATKNVHRGTWLYTQDMAMLRGENETLQIKFLGRKDETARIDEIYVFPAQIDTFKPKIIGVEDAASFICKSATGPKLVACAFVKKPGVNINEKELLIRWGTRLPPVFRPTAAFAVDQIPRDRAGNVNRLRLSREFAGLANAS